MNPVDVVVIGAGPAGLLTRHVVSEHGFDAVCIDPRTNPQSVQANHVHLLRPGTIERIDRWLPDFSGALRRAGSLSTDSSGLVSVDAGSTLMPTRAVFDWTLASACGKDESVIHTAAKYFCRTQTGWRVSFDDGRSIDCRWLIDASGRARRTLRAIASMVLEPPVLHEGPKAGRYLSATVRGLATPASQAVLRVRGCYEDSPSVLGLRISDDLWQITLQLPVGSPRVDWNEAVAQLDEPLLKMFHEHEVLGKTTPYGEQCSSALEIDPDSTPPGWMIIGDALLCTPPYQGNGIASLIDHVDVLDRGLVAGDSFEAIRDAQFRRVTSAWLQATMMDSLTGRHFLSESDQRQIA